MLSTAAKRPEGSVTARDLADRAGLSLARAGQVLRSNPNLKGIRFRAGGKQGVCYVPVNQ